MVRGGQLYAPVAISSEGSRRLDGSQSRSGRCGEEKYLLPPNPHPHPYPGETNPDSSPVQQIAPRYADCTGFIYLQAELPVLCQGIFALLVSITIYRR
jgi:hypothetical protein